MKRLVILTSAFLMASPVIGLAQGSAGKPVAAVEKGAPNDANAAAAAKILAEDKKVAKNIPLTPAPDFEATDADGKKIKLSDYKGKWVVLEWTNPECPFVKKHYSGGNMQSLQKKYTKEGVIWLSVHSSAKGKEGYLDAKGVKAEVAKGGAAPTASLMDADGKVGKAYDAKNTPHMFVINPAQQIIYAGAIDDNSSPNVKDIATSKNYVATVLDANLTAKDPAKTGFSSRPYGCSVKYN